MQYDHKQLDDSLDAEFLRIDRHLDNITFSLAGDDRDSLLGGGIDTWNLGWTTGKVSYDDATAQRNDSLTAQTQGGFNKWTGSFSNCKTWGASSARYLHDFRTMVERQSGRSRKNDRRRAIHRACLRHGRGVGMPASWAAGNPRPSGW